MPVNSQEEEQDIFKTSKTLVRSPPEVMPHEHLPKSVKYDSMEEKMDNLSSMLQTIINELSEIKEIRKEINIIKKENDHLKDEITAIKKQKHDEKVEMEAEKMSWNRKLQALEDKLEFRERRERVNNIFVSGFEKIIDCKQTKDLIQSFLNENLHLNVTVIKAAALGLNKNGYNQKIAELNCRAEKIEVLKNKHKLKGTSVRIASDLTVQERKIQQKLQNIATDLRKEGNDVKVAYKKLLVNNKWYNETQVMEKLVNLQSDDTDEAKNTPRKKSLILEEQIETNSVSDSDDSTTSKISQASNKKRTRQKTSPQQQFQSSKKSKTSRSKSTNGNDSETVSFIASGSTPA